MSVRTVLVNEYECERCGYNWQRRGGNEEYPKTCANPKCRSTYWDKPRVRVSRKNNSR